MSSKIQFKGKLLHQLVSYGLVGLVHNGLGYFIYLLLTIFFGVKPLVAVSFLYPVGFLISFLGNKKISFEHKGKYLSSFAKFVITHSVAYFFQIYLIYIFVDVLGYSHEVVQLIIIIIIAIYLFLALKYFVFRDFDNRDKAYK